MYVQVDSIPDEITFTNNCTDINPNKTEIGSQHKTWHAKNKNSTQKLVG